jgi:hypothetical protein
MGSETMAWFYSNPGCHRLFNKLPKNFTLGWYYNDSAKSPVTSCYITSYKVSYFNDEFYEPIEVPDNTKELWGRFTVFVSNNNSNSYNSAGFRTSDTNVPVNISFNNSSNHSDLINIRIYKNVVEYRTVVTTKQNSTYTSYNLVNTNSSIKNIAIHIKSDSSNGMFELICNGVSIISLNNINIFDGNDIKIGNICTSDSYHSKELGSRYEYAGISDIVFSDNSIFEFAHSMFISLSNPEFDPEYWQCDEDTNVLATSSNDQYAFFDINLPDYTKKKLLSIGRISCTENIPFINNDNFDYIKISCKNNSTINELHDLYYNKNAQNYNFGEINPFTNEKWEFEDLEDIKIGFKFVKTPEEQEE